MRVLAAFVVVAIPLYGMAISISSIVAPAHYHLPLQATARVAFDAGSPHHHSALAEHEHEHEDDHDDAAAGVHYPAPPTNYPVHSEHHDASERLTTLEPDHDHGRAAGASHHESRIGHHSHHVDQSGVVYLESDPDRSDLGAAGNHASPGADAALPARALPIPPIAGRAHSVPEGIRLFASRDSEPPLRPPSRHGRSHA
jgi:hypothetical protein